jgi:hypothetical protein
MRRTVPQVMMLNYAAWREFTNSDIKAKAKYAKENDDDDPFLPEMGVTMSELTQNSDLMDSYLSDWSGF